MAKIPDRMELVRWLRDEGLTNGQALERYRAEGIYMTTSAISMFRRRNGLDMIQAPHDIMSAWAVAAPHRGLYAAKMLRFEGRRRRGEELPAEIAPRLEWWKAKLNADGVVVLYNPDTPEGWHYVPRREGVDLDLISDPTLADDGSLVT